MMNHHAEPTPPVSLRTFASLLLGLLALLATASPALAAELVELWSGTNQLPKVYVNDNQPANRLGGQTLAKYLADATSQKFDVVRIKEAGTEPGFYIGFRDPKTVGNAKTLYSVEVTAKGQVWIDGGPAPFDIRTAVMDLVQHELEYKFWSHNEIQVPKLWKLAFKPGKRAIDPGFQQIYLFNKEAFGMPGDFRFAIRAKEGREFTGNHTLYPLLTEAATANPEFFPMDDKGARKSNNLHFCYTAPGIVEALDAALTLEVEKRKGNVTDFIYFAGMGDWYGGMCRCERCTKIYDEETWTNPDGKAFKGYSATLIRMMNRTAESMEKKFPGIVLGTFAYMSIDNPPAITKPRPNVIVQIPRLRYDSCSPVDVSPRNRNYYLALQRWCEIAPNQIYIWEYGASFKHFLKPFPDVASMSQNIKVYNKLAVAGVMIQGNYVGSGSDLVVLKNWIWSRLLWDPSLDPQALLKEFCSGYYGEAGPIMVDYVNALDDSVKNPKWISVSEFDEAEKTFYTPELDKKLRAIIAPALEIAAKNPDPAYLRRVKEARASIEAVRLWKSGPMEERDGMVVRTDLEGNSFEDARDLRLHIRDGGVSEWSTGRNHGFGMVAMHGGPSLTIKEDKLTATIVPNLGGLFRVDFDGIPILGQVHSHPIGTGGDFVEKGEKNWGSMKVESGIGNWSPQTKQWNISTYQLLPGNMLRVQTDLELVTRFDGLPRGGSRTVYKAIKGELPKIEIKQGALYKTIAYKAGQKNLPMGRFDSIRLHYSKAGIIVEDTYPQTVGLAGDILSASATSVTINVMASDGVELPKPPETAEAPVRVINFSKIKPGAKPAVELPEL